MQRIIRLEGIDGAGAAAGATVVIDTFRAFTTAAVMLARGIDLLALASDIDGANDLAARLGALRCGEDHGVRPDDFDLGNSPVEALAHPGLEGSPVVMRTSAGTRSLVAALAAGGSPVYAGSLAVASATARAVMHCDEVTLVSAGLHGSAPAEEDDLTGDLIADLLTGRADPEAISRKVRASRRAAVLRSAAWAHPDDADFAAQVDRYDFAMEAVEHNGVVTLERRTTSSEP